MPTTAMNARSTVARDRPSWLSIIVVGGFASLSFVDISRTLCPAEAPARRSCLPAGGWLGGGPRSRRGAGSGPVLLRDVHVSRNERILLLLGRRRTVRSACLGYRVLQRRGERPVEGCLVYGERLPRGRRRSAGSAFRRSACRPPAVLVRF